MLVSIRRIADLVAVPLVGLLAGTARAEASVVAADSLAAGFANPPASARPQTWWHWMNGNVSKEGVTADLEAMAEIGLGGASLFDAGCGIPPGGLEFNSSAWFETVRHAAKEAQRLGLELWLPNCSGWSSSGGPWITPEKGMKLLEHVELAVTGPRRFAERLPDLPNPHGFAADIAVVAVPVPPAERRTMADAGVEVSAPTGGVRICRFPKPYAASGVTYRLDYPNHWANGRDCTLLVEASDDGAAFREVVRREATLSRRGDIEVTRRFEPFPNEVTARVWRVSFLFARPQRRDVTVAELELGRRLSVSHLADKTLHNRMTVVRDPDDASADRVVRKDAVRDLTSALGADGVLRWDVPAGDWRIIRLGFAANGRKNAPASDHGVGLEVDKLSPAAVQFHIDQYVARLVRHLGPYAANPAGGLNGILVDSYEVGSQNWTQGLEDEFARRRGYAMTPYLPVLAGTVVGSVDESERFLWDYRRTVADLFAEGYSGALQKACRRVGLKLTLEPYGNCPCDDLEYGEPVDQPQGEFWSWVSRDGVRGTYSGNVKMPASLAHVWGRRYCGAEAFTTDPGGGGRWLTTPFSLKAQGDRVFTKGVNRLVFHRFAHQPWTKPARLPGMTMGPWGMHFDRTQTWWKHGRAWIDYLSRCQWMLQQGTFAADVLFWHGEEAPSRGGHVVDFPEDFADHPVPPGYDRDVCSTRALTELKVERGRIVAPGGVRYALLVLQDVDEISPEALAAVERIVSAGGCVAAPRRPTRMPGLRDYPKGDAEIARRTAALWSRGIVSGAAQEGLAALRLQPDFICLSAPEGLERETAWIHRVYPADVDAYFVAAPNRASGRFTCSFRIDGRVPELWDAESGRMGLEPIRWLRRAGRTEVSFELPPSGSVFVVFRRPTQETSGGAGERETRVVRTLPLSAGWRVAFPTNWYEGGTAERTVALDRLVDWTTLDEPDLRYFSGTARYETVLPAVAVKDGERVVLDLGEVRDFAEVTVNGRTFPVLWKPPFRVDVTDAAKGPLTIAVRVTNLWPNRLIGDDRQFAEDCDWRGRSKKGPKYISIKSIPDWVTKGEPSPTGRHTFTTWKHWSKQDDLLPSGLLGPAELRLERHLLKAH